ncbi:MAG: Na/Pi cotransporter family protein [candidate division WOR-3 bacterium]|nr:Na/Pi cotransporter family protein [candidate division WOR-3 bacterium]MCX7947629.1 Na/Pi cotransporter family protein [candidate division WOR-3 bacterium]MDW8150507.1 Na/Pi cotransporter family protein [candidate division WOR-3 bacterium]
MIFLFFSVDIVKPYDNVYKVDLSGDNQVVIKGKYLKPLRIQIFENNEILKNYKVEVFLITPNDVQRYEVITDSLGYAIFEPPVPQFEGIYRVIFYKDNVFAHFKYNVIDSFFVLFSILQTIAGFVIFLYGMEKLNRGINTLAGVPIREFFKKFSENRIYALIVGIVSTIAIQSSTAINVMLVSFVDSGILSLKNALSIALGAGIGSTFTTQIISFGLFEISLILIILGYILKRIEGIIRAHGNIIFGIGLLFFSIKLMSDSVYHLSIFPQFINFFKFIGESVFWGIFISAVFTALIHSSAAVVGFAISLAFQDVIDLKAGIYIVLGANLGTSFTSILASINSGSSGKQIAFANFFYKFITFIIILIFIEPFISLIKYSDGSLTRQIANAHTFFNIIGAIIFLPFLNIAEFIFRSLFKETVKSKLPDPSIFESSSIAIAVAHRKIIEMSSYIEFMLEKLPEVFITRNPSLINKLELMDEDVDKMREEIVLYLIRLQKIEITEEEAWKLKVIQNIVDEFEAMGDIISKNIAKNIYKMYIEGYSFSKEGLDDLIAFHKEVMLSFQMMNMALLDFDVSRARYCYERRILLNNILDQYQYKHFERLKSLVQEAFLTSSVHIELLNNLERINYHITEICKEIAGN